MTTTVDESALLKWREEFPTLSTSVHLISHSLGAMPRGARAKVEEFFQQWETESIEAWHEWLPYVTDLGNVIADVVGVTHGSVVKNHNEPTLQSLAAPPAAL